MDNDNKQGKNAHDFKIERYKFILSEQKRLSENKNQYIKLFQTLTTAIVGAGLYVFLNWETLNITASVARKSIYGLFGLLLILTFFTVGVILAGIFSWFDYREDEVELLDEEVEKGFRSKPSWKGLWRWDEIYVIIFIIISVYFIYSYMINSIIPLIKDATPT